MSDLDGEPRPDGLRVDELEALILDHRAEQRELKRAGRAGGR